ncbi:hypothetical protein MPLDJ20_20531 [Mesorhizobium plurifarium]|uniref:Uncharacterized protein n=1 Tax=Mesorhizobium plurifarium TaxID=69974 RepID=A0A090F3Z6_MESPL|nr:hypothetical protein MPLDJ20_20531 [Mesorhizobium plurifarium]
MPPCVDILSRHDQSSVICAKLALPHTDACLLSGHEPFARFLQADLCHRLHEKRHVSAAQADFHITRHR